MWSLLVILWQPIKSLENEAAPREQSENKECPPPPASMRALIDLDRSLAIRYDENQKVNSGHQRKLFRTQVVLCVATIGAFAAASYYAFITKKVLKESQAQTRISQQQMEISERPWLSVRAEIDSPLVFNEPMPIPGVPTAWIHGETAAAITIKFTIINKGHSPAEGIQVMPEIFPESSTHQSKLEQERTCGKDYTIAPLNFPVGEVVFHDDPPLEEHIGLTVSKSDMDAAVREFRKRFNDLVPGTGDKMRPSVSFFLVGCVNYQSNFTNAALIGSLGPVKQWQRCVSDRIFLHPC